MLLLASRSDARDQHAGLLNAFRRRGDRNWRFPHVMLGQELLLGEEADERGFRVRSREVVGKAQRQHVERVGGRCREPGDDPSDLRILVMEMQPSTYRRMQTGRSNIDDTSVPIGMEPRVDPRADIGYFTAPDVQDEVRSLGHGWRAMFIYHGSSMRGRRRYAWSIERR